LIRVKTRCLRIKIKRKIINNTYYGPTLWVARYVFFRCVIKPTGEMKKTGKHSGIILCYIILYYTNCYSTVFRFERRQYIIDTIAFRRTTVVVVRLENSVYGRKSGMEKTKLCVIVLFYNAMRLWLFSDGV